MNLNKILTTVVVATFVLVGGASFAQAQTADGEITNPATDGIEVSGTTTLTATYDDGDNVNEGVDWAVRAGTCDENDSESIVAGNVGGHGDSASFDGETFTFDFDTTEHADGDYCFAFNPIEDDEVSNDVREIREFTINNSVEGAKCEAEFSVTYGEETDSGLLIDLNDDVLEDGATTSLFATSDTAASSSTTNSGEARIERTSDGFKLFFAGGGDGTHRLEGSFQFDGDVDLSNATSSTPSDPIEGLDDNGSSPDDVFEINEASSTITFDLRVANGDDFVEVSGLSEDCPDEGDGNDNEEADEDESASSGGGGGGGDSLSSRGDGDVAGDRDSNNDDDDSDGEVLGAHDDEITDEELSEMLDEARQQLLNLLAILQNQSTGFPNTGDGSLGNFWE